MCVSGSMAPPMRWTTLPKLKKTEKHNIDVVIDRVQGARPDKEAAPEAE